MNYTTYSHRHADLIALNDERFSADYNNLIQVINNITDQELMDKFIEGKQIRTNTKSLSDAINYILKERLIENGWSAESSLFKQPPYNTGNKSRWRLDFAKNEISIEVAFNHQEATAHNIMKPVLASELNHVQKDIQTSLGVIITATQNMKTDGNFDGAIGTFESFIEYFKPYNNIISVPIILIGLESPDTFQIDSKSKMPKIRD